MPANPSRGQGDHMHLPARGSGVASAADYDFSRQRAFYLATLLNGEYAWTEVGPGTVARSAWMAKMYYGPSIIMSSAAAVNQYSGPGRENTSQS